MTIDIDINDLKAHELIKLLETYPHGRLVIKFERVFWSSEQSEPYVARDNPGRDPHKRVNPPSQGAGAPFQRMADVLGSMVAPPQRH